MAHCGHFVKGLDGVNVKIACFLLITDMACYCCLLYSAFRMYYLCYNIMSALHVTSRAVPNITFVIYSAQIPGQIMYSYSAEYHTRYE